MCHRFVEQSNDVNPNVWHPFHSPLSIDAHFTHFNTGLYLSIVKVTFLIINVQQEIDLEIYSYSAL